MCRTGNRSPQRGVAPPGAPATGRPCAREAPSAGPRGFRRAFTLVETIVVIVLIAVVAAMAVTSLGGNVAAAELRTAARRLHLAADGARSRAALYAVATRITFDPAGNRYLLEQESADVPGTFEPLRDGVHKPAALPSGVSFGYFDVESLIPGETSVRFNPEGDATAAVIEVTDGRRSFTLRVDASTGRVELSEGQVFERLSERIDLDA